MTMTREQYDAALRLDFHMFVGRVFDALHPPGTFKDNWHLEVISRRAADVWEGKTKRLIVNAPPRGLKSMIVSIALPAFILGRNPAEKIICISHDTDLAGKLARACRTVLQSDWYRRLFPGTVLSKTAEDELETTAGGGRKAVSIESGITGHGGNYIIMDDPMSAGDAPSASAREKVKRLFREAIFSRLDDKANGRIILVMQRLHEDDLSGFLEKLPGFEKLVLPAIATQDETYTLWNGRAHARKNGELLHPRQEPQSAIDEAKALQTSANFEAFYQQNPVPDTGLFLKADWIQRYKRTPSREGMHVTISVDTAIKGNPESDYSVATVWAEQGDRHYLLDVYRKRVDITCLVDDMAAMHRQYQPEIMLVEEQGSGVTLHAYLSKLHNIYPRLIRPKGDKESRFASACFYFEKQQVLLPEDAPWLAEYERELFGFPAVRNDDQVDSTSQYFLWSRDRGDGFIYHRLFEYSDPTPETLKDVLAQYSYLR